jgi:hypothetical protein
MMPRNVVSQVSEKQNLGRNVGVPHGAGVARQ